MLRHGCPTRTVRVAAHRCDHPVRWRRRRRLPGVLAAPPPSAGNRHRRRRGVRDDRRGPHAHRRGEAGAVLHRGRRRRRHRGDHEGGGLDRHLRHRPLRRAHPPGRRNRLRRGDGGDPLLLEAAARGSVPSLRRHRRRLRPARAPLQHPQPDGAPHRRRHAGPSRRPPQHRRRQGRRRRPRLHEALAGRTPRRLRRLRRLGRLHLRQHAGRRGRRRFGRLPPRWPPAEGDDRGAPRRGGRHRLRGSTPSWHRCSRRCSSSPTRCRSRPPSTAGGGRSATRGSRSSRRRTRRSPSLEAALTPVAVV